MKNSLKSLKSAGIKPKLKLGKKLEKGGVESLGLHTVTLLGDKIVKGLEKDTGKECYYMVYTVEHDGVEKQYTTRLKSKETGEVSYFVQALAELGAGSVVNLEMKKAGIKNYIEINVVEKVPETEETEVEPEPVDDASEETEHVPSEADEDE